MWRKENKFVGHAQDGPGLIPFGILNKRHLGNKIFVIFKIRLSIFTRSFFVQRVYNLFDTKNKIRCRLNLFKKKLIFIITVNLRMILKDQRMCTFIFNEEMILTKNEEISRIFIKECKVNKNKLSCT